MVQKLLQSNFYSCYKKKELLVGELVLSMATKTSKKFKLKGLISTVFKSLQHAFFTVEFNKLLKCGYYSKAIPNSIKQNDDCVFRHEK